MTTDLADRFAAALDPATKSLAVAVSGGGDSMACLDLADDWAKRRGVHLRAVTVDHGLRPEAADEAVHVTRVCAARGIPHAVLHWHWDRRGNLQASARQGRYALIGDWAQDCGIDTVVLGHTTDDIAESFLLRLRRAPGVDGLAAMPSRFERHGVRWVRPLLRASRAELRRHLTARGLGWVEDPSNDDPRYDRARARALRTALEPLGVTTSGLARAATALRDGAEALDWAVSRIAEDHVTVVGGDLLLERLDDLPAELARRLTLRALRVVGGAPPPRQAALTAIHSGLVQAGQHTLAGCLIRQDGAALRIAREPAVVSGLRMDTTEPWDRHWRLQGPHAPQFQIAALGDAVALCPDWRQTGFPRDSLRASPAIWRNEELIAAPLAGLSNGWSAEWTGWRDESAPSGYGN
ncbi:tRNA lysidine(34) synthetase TilS [Palleronia caenipelagi]|uniref:tRNA(Ile)-lysidine synthase n=1 Tax=Palleronia caenipelagi TaxID=2489174 RepID=A0A547Q5P8_9RHOB|nr:tRNA lysidine(34) synthetase TilS [Palleronia caenipelagi]TRD21667.1 tRNA lysidine(34) synthetase TilS [Palleronia caenipelagi]